MDYGDNKTLIALDLSGQLHINGEPTGTFFTSHEERFLRAIFASQSVVSREMVMSIMYGGSPDEPELKIMDVYLCKVKRKLGIHRDALVTVWGRGWHRSPAYKLQPSAPNLYLGEVDMNQLEYAMQLTELQPNDVLKTALALLIKQAESE